MALSHDTACYIDWLPREVRELMPQSTYSHIERGISDADIDLPWCTNPRAFSSGCQSVQLSSLSGMGVDRSKLHDLVDALPEEQAASVGDDLRRRLPQSTSDRTWPPEFFNIIDGTDPVSDIAGSVDSYLSTFGFGRNAL